MEISTEWHRCAIHSGEREYVLFQTEVTRYLLWDDVDLGKVVLYEVGTESTF